MSKFNSTTKGSTKTINYDGLSAYTQFPEKELYLMVCNSLLENKFYEKKEDQMIRLIDLIKKVDKEFLCNLIIYVREKMYLRSITHVLVVELARLHKGLASDVIERVCKRPDDMTEILAYQLQKYGKPIPNQIKKGLANAFLKFDEYQLQKYNAQKVVKLKDILFLCHVKGNELTKKLIEDKLETPYTWETEISDKGNKKEVWDELVDSGKLGFMALLRNLRNILDVCNGSTVVKVIERLQNKEEVEKSKQLPFRFWSAYRELQENNNPMTSLVLGSLDVACGYSAKNLKLSGVSFVASDVSGSMQQCISERSKVQYIDIGLVMQGIAKKISPMSITGIFGDDFKIKNYPVGSVFSPVLNYREGEVGYSTNGYKCIEYLNDNNLKVDNILLFTDCEMYGGSIQSELQKYKTNINKDVKVFIFNLAGYSTVQFPENSVYEIGGWSDKVFDYIEAVDKPIKELLTKK